MSNFCCADIETVPNPDLPKECIPQFDPDSVKLGNLKDKDKIEAKIEEARQEFDRGLVKKMSLDPDLCRVVCVGYADRTGASTYMAETARDKHRQYTVIEYAISYINSHYLAHHPLITFNGISFDLPVLWHSAIRLGIPVDPQMYKDLTKKHDNRYHYDLFPILCDWDRQRYKGRGLEFWARLYGIGEKMGDGSEIYGWWQAKEYEKIRQHCEADVNVTVKLWERIEPYVREKE